MHACICDGVCMDTCIMNTVHSFMHVIFQRACACECIQTRHACAFMDIYSCAQVDKRLERLAKDMKVHMPACLHACVQANAHTPMNSLSACSPPPPSPHPRHPSPILPFPLSPAPPALTVSRVVHTHTHSTHTPAYALTHCVRAAGGLTGEQAGARLPVKDQSLAR